MTRGRIHRHFDAALVVAAYRGGYFPMADSRTGSISWFSPDPRAVIPLDAFNLPRSLRRALKNTPLRCSVNCACERVIRECAERGPFEDTWISDEIIRVYTDLHRQGIVHSIETWRDTHLVGGLYGVAIAGAFFGESMFSRESNASKFALIHLVSRLRLRGFRLLDTQIMNEHVRQFGAIDIPRATYLELLEQAISLPVNFLDNSQSPDL